MRKICPSCSKPFESIKTNNIYCCAKCRNKANSKNRREELKKDVINLRASKYQRKNKHSTNGDWLDFGGYS